MDQAVRGLSLCQLRARRSQCNTPVSSDKSAAARYYQDVVESQLHGEAVPLPDLTLGDFVPLYLEGHGAGVRPWTSTLCAGGWASP